jgi:hypothetical protein
LIEGILAPVRDQDLAEKTKIAADPAGGARLRTPKRKRVSLSLSAFIANTRNSFVRFYMKNVFQSEFTLDRIKGLL